MSINTICSKKYFNVTKLITWIFSLVTDTISVEKTYRPYFVLYRWHHATGGAWSIHEMRFKMYIEKKFLKINTIKLITSLVLRKHKYFYKLLLVLFLTSCALYMSTCQGSLTEFTDNDEERLLWKEIKTITIFPIINAQYLHLNKLLYIIWVIMFRSCSYFTSYTHADMANITVALSSNFTKA